MAAINFSGISSGLDTDLIIQSLLINRQLRVDSITDQIETEATKKRALGDVKTTLSTFQGIADSFTDEVFDNRTVVSSDTDVLTATADGDSAIGEHEIKVNTLAARSVVSIGAAQSSATAQVGAGTLTLNQDGGGSFAVTLTDPGATLTDLRDEINDQHGESLQASIIEVQSGSFQLVVSTKETGASLNIKDDAAATDPSSLASFDAGFQSGGINSEQTGVDSEIEVDGITITRSDNKIDDVLEGVTLTLKGTSGGSNVNLKIDTDLEKITSQFEELANGFNDVLSQIDRVTNRETGVLPGDNDLLGLKRNLQSFITRFVPNSDEINIRDDGSVGFTALAQIGFKTDERTGELSVDKETLTEALEDHFSEVRNLFEGNFTSTNSGVSLTTNVGQAFSGQITLDTVSDTATIGGTLYNLERSGNNLSFASGTPYAGMVFFASASDANVTLEISSGLGALIDDQVDKFTNFSGILNDRSTTIDSKTRALEKEMIRAEDRLEGERTRLTAVFAKAEQAISTLQGLQSSLGAQSIGFGQ